jgi:hypothetical protein
MRKIFILMTLLVVAVFGCQLGPFPKPPPQPEPPSPWDNPSDAAPVPSPPDDSPCGKACAKLLALGCPEAQPTAAGATCTQVCVNNETGPDGTSLVPFCVAAAESCSIARACM